ncbi:MAG: tRNA (adenosine(37)-N6)-threonylcarbamoyltransferase complex ATPase subunit type 1 TsaE [Ferruginibacter sp.]
MEVIFSLGNINEAAKSFLAAIGGSKIIALHGEMGAGKTTFVHAVTDLLGVSDSVSSPTYSIINEYTTATGDTVFHLDLYRLKDEQEVIAAGVEDCFSSGALCLIEWPGVAERLLPEGTVHAQFTVTGNNERMLQIKL